MIVSVINQKGGAGKTTIALNLAGAWAAGGARVMLIDADPQGTARDWAAVRETPSPFEVRHMAKPMLHQVAAVMGGEHDWIVIDGPPRNNDIARSAILAGDLVLIPVQPSGADFWASRETVELVREASAFGRGRAAFVISRRIGRSMIGRAFVSQLGDAFGLPVLGAGTAQRVAYADAMTAGMTVLEHEPKSMAAGEALALAAEIEAMMLERRDPERKTAGAAA